VSHKVFGFSRGEINDGDIYSFISFEINPIVFLTHRFSVREKVNCLVDVKHTQLTEFV
jgi:hypothetical protein